MWFRLLLVLVLAPAAAAGAPPEVVELDLRDWAWASNLHGKAHLEAAKARKPGTLGEAAAADAAEAASDVFRQAGRGTIELFVRLPRAAELRFELRPEREPGSFAVVVDSDRSRATLTPERTWDGEWRAPLWEFAGAAVRLRFENRVDEPLEWVAPRILGETQRAPPLEPGERPPAPLNFLLYVMDTARADRLVSYGGKPGITPQLDALAQRSTLLVNAYAPAPVTGPSVASLFSGLHPSRVGGRPRADGPALHTLAESFGAAGWATGAFQANMIAKGFLGFGRGFDVYDGAFVKEEGRMRPFTAEELHARAIAWLRTHRDGPFFLYIQSMDVHEYTPPDAYVRRFLPDGLPPEWEELPGAQRIGTFDAPRLGALYDGSYAYADRELARLLEVLAELGVEDRTVVLVTSDHGEPLGQRDHFFHGMSLYEELVRVPMLLALPRQEAPRRVEAFVSLMDLAPTLLDLAGIAVPEHFEGRSLLRSAAEHERAVGARNPFEQVDKSYVPEEWYLRRGPWKLLVDLERVRLFHLPTDPAETRDVRAEHPIEAATLTVELIRSSPAFREEWRRPPAFHRGLDAQRRRETEDALRALGYLE